MPEVPLLREVPDERRVLRRAAPLLRGRWPLVLASVAANAAAAAVPVAGVAVLGRVTDAAVAGRHDQVLLGAGLSLLLAAAGFGLVRLAELLVVRLGESVVASLRESVVERLAAAPLRVVRAHRRGALLRRATGEVAELSAFVGGTLPSLVTSAALLTFTTALLVATSPLMAAVLLGAAVGGAWLLVHRFLRAARVAYPAVAAAAAQVSAGFSESVAAREELRLLGAGPRRTRLLARDAERLRRAEMGEVRADLWLVALGAVQGLALAVLAVLAFLGTRDGWLTVGGAVVFLVAARGTFGDVEDVVLGLGDVRAARTGLARVLDLLDALGPPDRALDAGTADADAVRGALRVDGVRYSHGAGAPPVLDGVALAVHPGEVVALVGPTGVGKTTLATLLAGLDSPDAGSVTVGGRTLADLPPTALRRAVAHVPQEVVLVRGTVGENLGMALLPSGGPDALAVADRLGLGPWLAGLPRGLDTPVGEHGDALSAGERQLVALWRACLVDPEVLVLDEVTADVDVVTAARVEAALRRAAAHGRGRAVVLVSHRPQSAAGADRVLELRRTPSGGRLVGACQAPPRPAAASASGVASSSITHGYDSASG